MMVLRTDLEGMAGKEVQAVGDESSARLVKFESSLRHQAEILKEQRCSWREESGRLSSGSQ